MLSKKAQYAIYALLRLAKEYDKGPVLISSISESENIPKKFLETILLDLKNQGILASKKGKGGGYYLIKKSTDVNLAEIVRRFDGALALLPCASENYYEPCNHCKDEEKCGVKKVFRLVREESYRILGNSTLADIIASEIDIN